MKMLKFLRKYHADLGLLIIVSVWGLHFIVVKDAFSRLGPMPYNAIRFLLGLPFISLPLLRNPSFAKMARRDALVLFGWSMLGYVGYQVMFVLGLNLTTATNSALLVATLPAWVATMSIMLGLLVGSRKLYTGIAITLSGVILVVLGNAEGGPSLSSDDLIGSAMLILGVLGTAICYIKVMPMVERYGSIAVAIWTYWFTCAGLVVLAVPDLIELSGEGVPASVWPNLLYSGLLSSVCGYLIWNYGMRKLGPTRAATYNNVSPLVAAVAGILLLDEPVTFLLIIGGGLTLVGVLMVRGTPDAAEHEIDEVPLEPTPIIVAVSVGD